MVAINLNAISDVILNMKCATHGLSPSVSIEDNAVFYKNVCCSEFEAQLDEEYEKQVEAQVAEHFQKLFDK